MFRKIAALSIVLVASTLVACGGGSHSAGGTNALPMTATYSLDGGTMQLTASMPAHSIGEELPTEGVGSVKTGGFGTVGGFTQMKYAQTLAFPPGTRITIHNLSSINQHTLDVVKIVNGDSARFPKNPVLSTTAHGKGVLGVGYASGVINPGKSVTVLLKNEGTYLIGCAFHYSFGMKDVIVVKKGAKPGPQGTPVPSQTSAPSPTPTSGGGGGGW